MNKIHLVVCDYGRSMVQRPVEVEITRAGAEALLWAERYGTGSVYVGRPFTDRRTARGLIKTGLLHGMWDRPGPAAPGSYTITRLGELVMRKLALRERLKEITSMRTRRDANGIRPRNM